MSTEKPAVKTLSGIFPGHLAKSPRGYSYFMPSSISVSHRIDFVSLFRQVEKASLALGQFTSLVSRVPNPDMFIHSYSRKEAALSSRIEGTQTEIREVFMVQEYVAVERRDDWAETDAYIRALDAAVGGLETLPLCNRLLRDTHKVLLSQVRGKDKLPGEFRRSQNWIGGRSPDDAHYVPPSHEHVPDAMSDLEKFIQDDHGDLPHLVKAALIHYQFETIHPFLDGNGRLGRMLISLYLLEKKVLSAPILYISSFFERNRDAYYAALTQARKNEAGVIAWVAFFLDGVQQTALQGIRVTEALVAYRDNLVEQKIPALGKRTPSGLKLLDHLFNTLVVNAKMIRQNLGWNPQITNIMLNEFVQLGILTEITGWKRNRVFALTEYLDILETDGA